MKLYQRLALVLILLLGTLLAVLFVGMRHQQRAILDEEQAGAAQESARIDAVMKAEAAPLAAFTNAQSWSDALLGFLNEPDGGDWWREHFWNVRQSYGADGVWLLHTTLAQRAAFVNGGMQGSSVQPFYAGALRAALKKGDFGHTFAREGRVLWELHYAPVQSASDMQRSSLAHGYLIVGRVWDDDQLAALGALADADFRLAEPRVGDFADMLPYYVDPMTGEHRFTRMLGGEEGAPAARLSITRTPPGYLGFSVRMEENWRILATLLGLVAVLLAFYAWSSVSRPMRRLAAAVERRDSQPVQRLARRRGEVGMLARAILKEQQQRSDVERRERSLAETDSRVVQREHFLSTILRHFAGVAAVINRDGVLKLVEGREVDAYGLRKDRDEGRPINKILRGQERLALFEAALQGQKVSQEHRVGERHFMTVCDPLLDERGNVELVVVLAMDLTEKKATEEALMRAKTEAERADRLKSQFLAVMSHETRTPLNGVLGYASVLRETDLSEEQMSYLERIVESAKNLLRLLTDILDLTRLEAGEAVRRIEPVSLTALAYQFGERYRIAAREKGKLEFELEVDPALPEYIDSDHEMISRVLGSLLDNAVKFTERGKISLSLEWVTDAQEQTGVRFEVADTGPGISRELMRTIFDPFQQGDSSRTRRHGGIGLGLTIAHRLALQLDGQLLVESEVGKGSTFTFFLPAVPGTGEAPGPLYSEEMR